MYIVTAAQPHILLTHQTFFYQNSFSSKPFSLWLYLPKCVPMCGYTNYFLKAKSFLAYSSIKKIKMVRPTMKTKYTNDVKKLGKNIAKSMYFSLLGWMCHALSFTCTQPSCAQKLYSQCMATFRLCMLNKKLSDE